VENFRTNKLRMATIKKLFNTTARTCTLNIYSKYYKERDICRKISELLTVGVLFRCRSSGLNIFFVVQATFLSFLLLVKGYSWVHHTKNHHLRMKAVHLAQLSVKVSILHLSQSTLKCHLV
jgi:hypothetical protein